MDLLSLPIEIQEHILSFLDASSLIQCSKVCVLWKDLCRGCWRHCCLREIPSDVLTEIIGSCPSLTEFLQQKETPLAWEVLFLKWNHYAVVKRTPHQKFSLPFKNTNSLNRCIIKLSGDFLVLAPTVENVRVYKVHLYESGRCVGILAKHNKPVQDIVVMDVQKRSPYKLKGSRKIAEHDTVISISSDGSVQINEFNCHGHRPMKLWEKYLMSDCLDATIKVFGNTFIIACQDRRIYMWSVSCIGTISSYLSVQEHCHVSCPTPITHINIWKNEIICLWWNLPGVHLIVWDLVKQNWVENLYIEDILCGPNISTFRSLIFGVGSQLTILKNRQFFQKYDLWEALGQSMIPVEKVTSVCLKRNLLAFGTQLGEVYIFLINQDNQLRDLKSTQPVNAIKVTSSTTRAQQEIKNLDMSFDGSRLQIAAQTTQAVHIINWFPFEKELQHKPEIELPSMSEYYLNDSDLSDPDYWFYDSD